MTDLVIGVDAGGTTTRCVVADVAGRVLGEGTAVGANQNSSEDPASALSAALTAALHRAADSAEPDPGTRVRAGVFAVAGAGSAGRAGTVTATERAWDSAGLPGRPEVVPDILAAFAAGTPASEGTVLVAGTGAVAAAVRDERLVARCDGYGWILGDEGSAVWVGLAACRAALAAVDGRGSATELAREVPRTLLGDPAENDTADTYTQRLIAAVHRERPARIGVLAPVVGRLAAAGDPVARDITATAGDRLVRAVDSVRPGVPAESPTVLAGSVLDDGPVADAVHAGLTGRGIRTTRAAPGALGAAALATGRVADDPARAHNRLLSQK